MSSLPRVAMVDAALAFEWAECGRSLSAGMECGASLIGVRNKTSLLIFYAFPTGPLAERSRAGVTTDANFQNRAIRFLQERYPDLGLRYLGDYHLHPFPMDRLSGTDLNTIREILWDPDHGNVTHLCVQLMYAQSAHALGLKTFLARRIGPSARVHIEEVPLEVVPPDHPLVRSALKGRDYLPITEVLAAMPVPIPIAGEAEPDVGIGTVSELLAGAPGRIQREAADLCQHLGWRTKCRKEDPEGQILEGTLGGFELVLCYPPEYPLNGPTVLYRAGDETEFAEFAYKLTWNSHATTFDILEEFQKEIRDGNIPAPRQAGGKTGEDAGCDDESRSVSEDAARNTITIV